MWTAILSIVGLAAFGALLLVATMLVLRKSGLFDAH